MKKCAKATGNKRIELVAVKELLNLTGYIRGGCSPIGMKKSRPGVILRAIVDDANLHAVERALFKHTSTIGYRRIPVERNCMSREMQELETPFGKVRLKKSTFEDIKKVKLEFDDLKEIAEKTGLSISEIKSKILAEKS